ncbi:uncharacterized protein LOC143254008 isoform X1 [Tachypleus tridentatus]|uniref:uncharacterized protein LOC143254008 isoform X1 n=1 Tax=Tachypleus tridentatus TaxID=6853 RepID=UPI003FCFF8D5
MDWLQVAQLGHQAMTLEKGSSRQLRKGYFVENLSKHQDPDKSNIPLLQSPDRDSAEDWGHNGSQDNSSLTKSGKSSVNNVWGTPSRNFKKKPSCSSPQKPKTRDGRSPLLSRAKRGKNGKQLLINFGDESGRNDSDDDTVVDNCDINKGHQKVTSTK